MPPPSLFDVLNDLANDASMFPILAQATPKDAKPLSIVGIPTWPDLGLSTISLSFKGNPGVAYNHPSVIGHFNKGRERLGVDGWFWRRNSTRYFTIVHDPEQTRLEALLEYIQLVRPLFLPPQTCGPRLVLPSSLTSLSAARGNTARLGISSAVRVPMSPFGAASA